MKYTAVLFIILFPVFATAQTQKEYIDSLAKNVLLDLQDSWTLGIDSNNEAVDIRLYNKFKSLFDTTATIVDDINAYYQFDPGGHSGTYTTEASPKLFEIYAHDVALQVKSINIDIDSIIANTSDPDAITFTVRRKVEVQKTRQYVIPDTKAYVEKIAQSRHIEFERAKDALDMKANLEKKLNDTKDAVYSFSSIRMLRIIIKYDSKDSSCKIMAIEDITKDHTMLCLNDDDRDGILNQEDSLINTPGDFSASGMPDYDFDGVPDKTKNEDIEDVNNRGIDKCSTTYGIAANHGCPVSYFSSKKQTSGFMGIQLNSAKINLPELNQLGYQYKGNDATDVLQSKKGALQNPGLAAGIDAGANFAYYFGGKKKKTGISFGLGYSGFTARYKLTAPIVYTFKSSDGINDYRRQITIRSMDEEIGYNVFNIPVQFSYRTHLGKKNKSVFSFKTGPSLMFFRNTSSYNTTIDFGGVYQANGSGLFYDDHFDNGSSWNVYVTSDSINAQNTNPGSDSVFHQLKDYDFASNKNYHDKVSVTRVAVAFNFDFEVQRPLSYGLAIKVGAHLVYAPLFERNKKYIPVNKTSDPYNSIYNSTAKSSYSAFGVYAGFVYDF